MSESDLSSHGSVANRIASLEKGVRYVCQRCAACCKWPGDVRLEEDEVRAIAKFLNLGEEEFIARFTRLRGDRMGLSLIEKDNHECVMLDGNICTIQTVKPIQCRGFPNHWNFPGWREVCEAIPVSDGSGE